MFGQRKFGDKVYYFARACEGKNDAKREAELLRKQGFLARIVPIQYYFDLNYQVYTYPKETFIS